MFDYLLNAISCFCFLQLGFCSDKCSRAVLGRREMLYVPEGGSLTLSCVVQHCDSTWERKWKWEKSSNSSSGTVEESAKHRLTSVELTANKTRLDLFIRRVSQSDGASYRCGVTWDDDSSEVGHWMDVNVTKAVPVQRNVLHRALICGGAVLCLPVFLGLAYCLSSKAKPQPHPRIEVTYAAVQKHRSHTPSQPPPRRPVPKKRTSLTHKASTNSQKIELVYADISQDALRQQEATREPVQSTVYSSVKFS